MNQSWLSSTINYVYNTVSGDERDRSVTSDYQRVFSNGVWINDLPTSVYEPLETSCVETQATPQQVRVSFPLVFFSMSTLILTPGSKLRKMIISYIKKKKTLFKSSPVPNPRTWLIYRIFWPEFFAYCLILDTG